MTEFDQRGQRVQGNQYNAGRDINNIYSKAPWTPPLMLPPRAQSFVGRQADIDWLQQVLLSPIGSHHGVKLALCGPGGMGKTALAAEVLMRLVDQDVQRRRFPDGIFYHSFYAYPSLPAMYEELAHVFDEEPGADPRRAATRALNRRCALLVFDGVENLEDARPLWELAGTSTVLVLSRRQSDAPDLAHRRDLGLLSQEQGIMLLQELGGSRAADRGSVERLVQQIGGYPLALQLIGSYLTSRQEEAAEYLQWFESEGLAAVNYGTHPAQSIPVLLQRTYDSLPSLEQQVFMLLGLLAPAPFPLELVQGILDRPERAVRQAMGSLVNVSVLRRPEQGYEVSHPLVHTFATEYLVSRVHGVSSPSPETIALWRERVLATLATHFEQSDSYDRVGLALWQPHVIPLLSAEHPTTEQSLRAARLFNTVGFHAYTQGKYVEVEPLLKRALAIREQELGGKHLDTATSLNNLAELYKTQGKYTEAEPLYNCAHVARESLSPVGVSSLKQGG